MKKHILLLTMALMFLSVIGISAADNNGRDLLTLGEKKEISGTFLIEDDEWYLQSGNVKYLIHQGPDFYTDEIRFDVKQNDTIKVYGYVYKDEVTPVKISSKDKNFVFRDDAGRPEWSGRGQGRNRR